MPDEPSGRGRRQFAGIGQPPFNVPAAPAAEHRSDFSTSSNTKLMIMAATRTGQR
jgi:hypothetical protein